MYKFLYNMYKTFYIELTRPILPSSHIFLFVTKIFIINICDPWPIRQRVGALRGLLQVLGDGIQPTQELPDPASVRAWPLPLHFPRERDYGKEKKRGRAHISGLPNRGI